MLMYENSEKLYRLVGKKHLFCQVLNGQHQRNISDLNLKRIQVIWVLELFPFQWRLLLNDEIYS